MTDIARAREGLDTLPPVMAVANSGIRLVGVGATASEARSNPLVQPVSDDYDEDALVDFIAWALNNRAILSTVPEPMEGWRPIETAPKDGTEILLFELTAAEPIRRAGYWEAHGTHIDDGPSSGWSLSGSGYIGEIEPTHWQPLPAPPNTEE